MRASVFWNQGLNSLRYYNLLYILQGKRVQKCVESLDVLKISNCRLRSVVTTKWETFDPPATTNWELFDWIFFIQACHFILSFLIFFYFGTRLLDIVSISLVYLLLLYTDLHVRLIFTIKLALFKINFSIVQFFIKD